MSEGEWIGVAPGACKFELREMKSHIFLTLYEGGVLHLCSSEILDSYHMSNYIQWTPLKTAA